MISEELEKRRSRWALSSGRAGESILDGKPGANSPFAAALLMVLKENTENYLNVAKLVDKVMNLTSANYEQLPEGNPLYGVGHEGGQFIFKLRNQVQETKKENEDAIWQNIEGLDSIIAYKEYLKDFPKGKFVKLARQKIAVFEEEKLWKEAVETNTIASLSEYLSQYPESSNTAHAKVKIQTLRKEQELILLKQRLSDEADSAQNLLEERKYEKAEGLFLKIFEELPEVLDSYLPEAVLNKGRLGIQKYFDQLKLGENAQALETRVILIGEGEVGKTSLARKLIDQYADLDKDEETTRGIDIHIWNFLKDAKKNVKARIWDFGGQEIYRSTHQFFFSKRTYYILVWDARREEKFDYWLQMIYYLADSSPTVLVQNKIDIRMKSIDKGLYQKNYENVQGYFNVSCLTNEGIEKLEKFIKAQIISMPHMELTIPASWVQIKEILEGNKKNYISHEEFLDLCEEAGLNQGSEELLEYLHDLGVILHFKKHHLLKYTIFLNPDWVTKAVYKILDHRKVIESGGYFNFEDLESILGEGKYRYPPSKYNDLIELMKKFEMCFQSKIGDGDSPPEYIVPELLSPSEPDLANFLTTGNEKMVRFEYSYPSLLPPGLLPRFICRNNQRVDKQQIWRRGAVLNYENSSALVRGFPKERKIKIMITGNSKRELLEIIRYHFYELHQTLNLIGVEAKLPCICSECMKRDRPNLYDYSHLKDRLIKTGKSQLECSLSYENISVLKLFGDLVEVINKDGNVTYNFYGDITGDHHQLGDNPTMYSSRR